MSSNAPSRRAFLSTGAAMALSALPLTSCTSPTRRRSAGHTISATGSTSRPAASASATSATAALAKALDALQDHTGRHIGVYTKDAADGSELSYQADERFPMCSTYKPLCVAAVLDHISHDDLRHKIQYHRADLVDFSPVTSKHVAQGMTVEQLCAAAIRYSDNTAANLVLAHAGGPAYVTEFLRRLGDPVTRLDRDEPTVNTAIPGDPRDTTTPRAIATDYLQLATTTALHAEAQALLVDWLRTDTTGGGQIRARAPQTWIVGDKTGSGDYGTTNDVAILWPPGRPPVAVAILTRTDDEHAKPDPNLIATVSSSVLHALQH